MGWFLCFLFVLCKEFIFEIGLEVFALRGLINLAVNPKALGIEKKRILYYY